MKKINLGCGEKYSDGWINLDFHSTNSKVLSCNFLKGIPFEDNEIDVIYSSHVLEHFTFMDAKKILKDCYSKLKKDGILRIVVPDMENICREYLRVLDNIDSENSQKNYEWVIIELIDQLVRTEPGGMMSAFWKKVNNENDIGMSEYIQSRTGFNISTIIKSDTSFSSRLKRITFNRIKLKLIYLYIKIIKSLLPFSLRSSIVDNTPVGEKHKWMYDSYSLKKILEEVGFKEIKFLSANTSKIDKFNDDYLDINSDGTPHKKCSLYCEAIK